MNSKAFLKYKETIFSCLDQIHQTQGENIETASQWIYETLKKAGFIYLSGTGHSHMIAEEIFYRAGGLAAVHPILDPNLMLHLAAERSSLLERLPGQAAITFNQLPIQPQDVLIVISNSGRNAYPIEMIECAKKKSCRTIAITSLEHSQQVQSRHSSGKKLYQIADLVIDNKGCYGDASINITGLETKMGATSTIAGVFIVQVITMMAVEKLINEKIHPDIFHSANIEETKDDNDEVIQKWRQRIHFL